MRLRETVQHDAEIRAIESGLVKRYTERFVGREWVFADIDRALARRGCRIVLLTGNAGIGKSTILAELSRRRPDALAFFLRRDSVHALRSSDARSFLLDLGFRLAGLRPELFAQTSPVVVEQDAGEIEAEGEMVGARIRKLNISPFERLAVEVRQRAGRVGGRMSGVLIEEYVAEARALSLEDLTDMALLRPLKRLAAAAPGERVLVLLDALDEILMRPERDGPADLLDFLATTHHLPANLRMVVTSRNGPHLEPLLGLRHLQHLSLRQEQPENLADLEQFVGAVIETRPEIARDVRERFRQQLLERCAGNFLYASVVLRGFRGTAYDEAISLLDTQPADVLGVYALLLRRAAASIARSHGPAAWSELAQPLLGVLSVARRPLTLPEVTVLTRSDEGCVASILTYLAPFVDMHARDVFEIRIFHATFAEYLTAGTDPLHKVYANRAIAAMRDAVLRTWGGMDAELPALVAGDPAGAYAVSDLPGHLLDAGDTRAAIEVLMAPRYLEARIAAGQAFSYLEDLNTTVAALPREQVPAAADALRRFVTQHVNWLNRHAAATLAQCVNWFVQESGTRPELASYLEERLLPVFQAGGGPGLFCVATRGSRRVSRAERIPPSEAEVFNRHHAAVLPDGRVLFVSDYGQLEILDGSGRFDVVSVRVQGLVGGVAASSSRQIVLVAQVMGMQATLVSVLLAEQTTRVLRSIDLRPNEERVIAIGFIGERIRLVTSMGRVLTVAADGTGEIDEALLIGANYFSAAWIDPRGTVLYATERRAPGKSMEPSLGRMFPPRAILEDDPDGADAFRLLARRKTGFLRLLAIVIARAVGRGETLMADAADRIDALCRLDDGTTLVARHRNLLVLRNGRFRRVHHHDSAIECVLQGADGRILVTGISTAWIDPKAPRRSSGPGIDRAPVLALLPDDQVMVFNHDGPNGVYDPWTGRRRKLALGTFSGFMTRSAAIAPDGTIAIASPMGGQLGLLGPGFPKLAGTIRRVQAWLTAAWTDNGFILPARDQTTAEEETFRLMRWNPVTAELETASETFPFHFGAIAVRDDRTLVLVDKEGNVSSFRDGDTLPRPVAKLGSFSSSSGCFGVLPNGGYVACDGFGTLRTWSADGQIMATCALDFRPQALVSSPRSGLITIAASDGTLHTFSMRSEPAAPPDESAGPPGNRARESWKPSYSSRFARAQARAGGGRSFTSALTWFWMLAGACHFDELRNSLTHGAAVFGEALVAPLLWALAGALLWIASPAVSGLAVASTYRDAVARNRAGRRRAMAAFDKSARRLTSSRHR